MALIASNGAGGGVYSAGASWAGGVSPALGDEAQVLAGDTITIDAGLIVGGDNPAVPAMDVLNGATLDWDNLGSDTATFRGDFYVRNGGTLTLDGTATLANVLTIELNDSAALVKNKYRLYLYGTTTITGFDKTRIEDDLSADAAAGQPDIVTDNNNSVNWRVGDEIWLVSPTTTTTEIRTVQNIVGATITFTVNLANAFPTDSYAINLTRNIIITVSSTAHPCAIMLDGSDLDVDWATLLYLGNTWGWGGIRAQNNGETLAMDYSVMRECVEHSIGGRNILNGVHLTYDIFYEHQNWYHIYPYEDLDISHCYIKKDGGAGSSVGVNIAEGSSLTDSFVWGDRGVRVTGSSWTVSDCVIWRSSIYGLWLYAAYAGTLQDNQYRRCTGSAIYIEGAAGVTDTNSIFANNTTDIYIASFADMFFAICNTISTITKVVGMSLAAKVRFYNCGGVTALHKAHLWAGSYEMQNIVVRTGTYAMLMSPSSATDALIAESNIPVNNGDPVAVSAFFRKNAAYGGANPPYLELSGAGITTSTSTMIDVDDTWRQLVVFGTPTRDGFAKLQFVCQSAGVGAACYVDVVASIGAGINVGLIGHWYEGDLSGMASSGLVGGLGVWEIQTAQLTAAGSVGAWLLALQGVDGDTLKTLSDQLDLTALEANVQAHAMAALNAYDPPTHAELLAALAALPLISVVDVWSYHQRTLTIPSAASWAATWRARMITDTAILVWRKTTWEFDITGLGNLTTRTLLYFTVKVALEDTDSQALLQIEEAAGLISVNGASIALPVVAGDGSLTVVDAIRGDIRIRVEVIATDIEQNFSLYDVRMITATDVLAPLTNGVFAIEDIVTEAIT